MNDVPIAQIVIAGSLIVLYLIMRFRKNQRRGALQAKITAGAKVIDVRSSAEFSSGHFAGAINIPVDKLPKHLKALGPRDSSIIVYCASGMRSANAQRILVDAGFTHVVNAGSLSAMPAL